jgi:hypothetical protein
LEIRFWRGFKCIMKLRLREGDGDVLIGLLRRRNSMEGIRSAERTSSIRQEAASAERSETLCRGHV